jgi:hypothetical protein
LADEVLHERELREQADKSHALVHLQEQRARELAFTEINRRLDEMNNLRFQIEKERGTYLQRDMYDREHRALGDAVDARLKILENKNSNLDGRMWAVGAAIGVIVLIINVAMHYWGK